MRKTLPLTPALSPWERENRRQIPCNRKFMESSFLATLGWRTQSRWDCFMPNDYRSAVLFQLPLEKLQSADLIIILHCAIQDQAEPFKAFSMAAGELRWVRSIAFHRKPDVTIESIFIDVVRLGEIHFLQLPRPVTLFVREWRRGDRSLGQGHIVGERCVRSKVRRAGEAIEHQWRHGILLVHGREAQDLLDGVQDAGLVIERAHDFSS